MQVDVNFRSRAGKRHDLGLRGRRPEQARRLTREPFVLQLAAEARITFFSTVLPASEPGAQGENQGSTPDECRKEFLK
jgi:hypothetical protein